MRTFEMREIREAKEYAKRGGQSLHLHNLTAGHPLFRRYKTIAHLFDADKERLVKTAKALGVKVIKVERENEDGQHIDLCGRPLTKALSWSTKYIPCFVISHVFDKNGVCLNCGYCDPLTGTTMTAKVEGDELVIRLPLELLIFAQAQREESLTITDKKAMGDYLETYILEFGGDADLGATEFEQLVDKCFMDALESGELWLVGWWEGDQ